MINISVAASMAAWRRSGRQREIMMTEVLTAEATLSRATILLSPAAMKASVILSTAESVIFAGPGFQATDTGTGA